MTVYARTPLPDRVIAKYNARAALYEYDPWLPSDLKKEIELPWRPTRGKSTTAMTALAQMVAGIRRMLQYAEPMNPPNHFPCWYDRTYHESLFEPGFDPFRIAAGSDASNPASPIEWNNTIFDRYGIGDTSGAEPLLTGMTGYDEDTDVALWSRNHYEATYRELEILLDEMVWWHWIDDADYTYKDQVDWHGVGWDEGYPGSYEAAQAMAIAEAVRTVEGGRLEHEATANVLADEPAEGEEEYQVAYNAAFRRFICTFYFTDSLSPYAGMPWATIPRKYMDSVRYYLTVHDGNDNMGDPNVPAPKSTQPYNARGYAANAGGTPNDEMLIGSDTGSPSKWPELDPVGPGEENSNEVGYGFTPVEWSPGGSSGTAKYAIIGFDFSELEE